MKRNDKIDCTLTGPGGEILFRGTTEEFKQASLAVSKGLVEPLLSRKRRSERIAAGVNRVDELCRRPNDRRPMR